MASPRKTTINRLPLRASLTSADSLVNTVWISFCIWFGDTLLPSVFTNPPAGYSAVLPPVCISLNTTSNVSFIIKGTRFLRSCASLTAIRTKLLFFLRFFSVY
jgi:hypothetical protein